PREQRAIVNRWICLQRTLYFWQKQRIAIDPGHLFCRSNHLDLVGIELPAEIRCRNEHICAYWVLRDLEHLAILFPCTKRIFAHVNDPGSAERRYLTIFVQDISRDARKNLPVSCLTVHGLRILVRENLYTHLSTLIKMVQRDFAQPASLSYQGWCQRFSRAECHTYGKRSGPCLRV